ncbi:MAG: hypothetical protein ACRERX_08645 [Pseudomonas sp.]
MKTAARPEVQSNQLRGEFTTRARMAPIKIARVLEQLINTKPRQRFETERIGDHCLHITIGSPAHDCGLVFKRSAERAPNHWGKPCDVTRHSLPHSKYRRARALLAQLTPAAPARVNP